MPVNIHGEEYFTVAERIENLNGDHGSNYSLITEVVQFSDDHCIMKATLTISFKDSLQTYTGHALERTSSSQINKTSHLENAETSAIGRALAAAGYAGTEYASADEVAQAVGQQADTPKASSDKPASIKQRDFVRSLLNKKDVDEETRKGIETRLEDPAWPSDKASACIEMLNGLPVIPKSKMPPEQPELIPMGAAPDDPDELPF